ncbi:MAG: hypothetical protein ACYDBZ_12140 [Steroidobacteraceae bacterium]
MKEKSDALENRAWFGQSSLPLAQFHWTCELHERLLELLIMIAFIGRPIWCRWQSNQGGRFYIATKGA